MKSPNLDKWKYRSDLEGLLLFAQLVEELLFDYTIDTYKVPAMNSHTLSNELWETLAEVEAGAIKPGAVKPIKEELCDRLTRDLVATSILGDIRDGLISWLKSHASIGETKVRAEFLKNALDHAYLTETIRLLKTALADAKQKERITSLTRTLITELIYAGYSPDYIYFETLNYFFTGRTPRIIDSISLVDAYLDRFSGKQLRFAAVFRVSANFAQLKGFAESAGITIQSDMPPIEIVRSVARTKGFLSGNESLPLYLLVDGIEACDVSSAREWGIATIQLLVSLARYHVHRQEFDWSDEAIICDEHRRSLGVYKKPVAPTLKGREPDPNRLSGLIAHTFTTLTSDNLAPESFHRISRAFARHDMAFRSKAPESQLLEFWSAIEVLFTTHESDEEKILQISKAIVPFQTVEYAAKLAADLCLAIKKCGKPGALDVLDKITEGSNEIEKCLALVSIKDNEDKRRELYGALEDHILLRNRVFYLQSKMSSADLIRHMLMTHDRRVAWQIHRIYRARNLYIHSGKSLQYVTILVENLHAYLDRVLDLLIERIEQTGYPLDVDQICVDLRLRYDAHLELLSRHKGKICTADNYKTLLFGH